MRGVIISTPAHIKKKKWDHKIKDLLNQVHVKEVLNKQNPTQLLATELNKTRAALKNALMALNTAPNYFNIKPPITTIITKRDPACLGELNHPTEKKWLNYAMPSPNHCLKTQKI